MYRTVRRKSIEVAIEKSMAAVDNLMEQKCLETVNALIKLYHIPRESANEHVNLIGGRRDDIYSSISNSMRRLISEVKDENIDRLNSAVERYDKWVEDLLKSETVKLILSNPKTEEEVRAATSFKSLDILSTFEESKLMSKEEINEMIEYTTDMYMDDLLNASCTLDFVTKDFSNKFRMVKVLNKQLKILESTSRTATSTFLDDLIKMTELTIYKDGRKHENDFLRSIDIVAKFINEPRGTELILDKMNMDAYSKLKDDRYHGLLVKIPVNLEERGKQIQFFVSSIEQLKEAKADIRVLEELVCAERPQKREEFLEIAANNPHILKLYEKLRRVQVKKEDYTRSITNFALAKFDEDTLIGVAMKVADKNYLENSKLLVLRGGELIAGGNTNKVYEICHSNENGYVWLKDYLMYKAAGSENKGLLALDIAIAKPNSDYSKRLRQKLSSMPDEALKTIMGISDIQLRIKKLDQWRETPSPNRTAPKIGYMEQDWYTMMRTALQNRGTSQKSISMVDAAHAKISKDHSTRLRDVWLHNPDKLERVCADVVAFGNNEGYNLILKNRDLFRAYVSRLGSNNEDVSAKINAIISVSNPYRALTEYLLPKVEEQPKPAVAEPIVKAGKENKYRRVLILGGKYEDREREFMIAYAGMPAKVYNSEQLVRNSDNIIRKDDLVIYITKMMATHDIFKNIKAHCESVGADLHLSNQVNTVLILNRIHTLTRQKSNVPLRKD